MASALKDSRTLFAELDGDNSGTIDEAEFGKLLAAMSLDVRPGQFAAIDKDSSSIEYGEFEAWSEANGLKQSAEALRAGWCAVLGREQASMVLEEELSRLGLAVSAAAVAASGAGIRMGLQVRGVAFTGLE